MKEIEKITKDLMAEIAIEILRTEQDHIVLKSMSKGVELLYVRLKQASETSAESSRKASSGSEQVDSIDEASRAEDQGT